MILLNNENISPLFDFYDDMNFHKQKGVFSIIQQVFLINTLPTVKISRLYFI